MQKTLSRRSVLAAGLSAVAVSSGWAATRALPTAVSLPDELLVALKARNPLVVLVSLDGCAYCKIARDNYLAPLREREGLPVVQVDMHSKQLLKDFRGGTMSHDEWIRIHGVKVAPTLLFFGRDGEEVAERMTGGYIADFYGGYLDARLSQARRLLAN